MFNNGSCRSCIMPSTLDPLIGEDGVSFDPSTEMVEMTFIVILEVGTQQRSTISSCTSQKPPVRAISLFGMKYEWSTRLPFLEFQVKLIPLQWDYHQRLDQEHHALTFTFTFQLVWVEFLLLAGLNEFVVLVIVYTLRYGWMVLLCSASVFSWRVKFNVFICWC